MESRRVRETMTMMSRTASDRDVASTAAPSDGPQRTPHRAAILSVLCVTLLLISLDNTVLNVALPSIVRSIGATSTELQWAVDAYALVFAGLLLSLGALGDRVGRKWTYLAGLAVFGGGSAFAAWSGNPDTLMAARAVMGVGAAALMPGTLSILTNVFSEPRERVRAIGIWSGTAGVGVALGPILGGFLLSHFWWGSVFLVNVPIAALGLVVAIFLVPNSRSPEARRPDPVGAVLSMVGMVSVVWAVIEAPTRGWSSPWIVASLVLGLLVVALFVFWERRIDHPMLPMSFFRDRRYSAAIAILCLVLFAMMGTFFLVTQFLQFSLGYSPLATGLRVAPLALTVLVVAPLAVLLARVIGLKVVVAGGLGLVAAGLGLISQSGAHTRYVDIVVPFVMVGVGVALTLSPCTASVMDSLPLSDAGVGSATNDTAMQVGGALGVGVMGTVLNFRYQDLLGPLLAGVHVPGFVKDLILGSLGGALAVAHHAPPRLGSALAEASRRAFISGMDQALFVGMLVAIAAAVSAAVFLPRRGFGSGTAGGSRPLRSGKKPSEPTREPAAELG